LRLSIADTADSVKLGGETTYHVIVTNDAATSDRDVQLVLHMPSGLRLKPGASPVKRDNIEFDLFRFEPIKELRAGESVAFDVPMIAETSGDARVQLEATSRNQSTPATAEESTNVLRDDE
jgi:hypothetical protein